MVKGVHYGTVVLSLQAYCLKVKEMDDEEYEAAVSWNHVHHVLLTVL